MTMKLKNAVLVVAICLCGNGFSQLSTRENIRSVFRTGSRPLAGSYGVYIGPSFMEMSDMADQSVALRGLPLINIKYYSADSIEWRLGLQFSGKSSTQTGTSLTGAKGVTVAEGSSYNRISIGGAYHFSPRNLLDVYVGAYIPFGWDTYSAESSLGKVSAVTSKFSPVFGVGAYIGLQAFIADLPISVGFEYGLRAIGRGWRQYKHVDVDTNGKSQTYYTTAATGVPQYSDLNYGSSDFGTDARITFSYYFNK